MGKPYISYLSDTYDRDRVIAYNKDSSDMYLPGKWALSNKHIININNMGNTELKDQVVGAITTFGNRIAPRLMLNGGRLIQDSLHNVSERIAATIDFVYKLAEAKKETCPFQYDATFAFNNVKPGDKKVDINGLGDNEPDDDDDDDNDDEKEDDKFYDCFGDLKGKLKQNECLSKDVSFKSANHDQAVRVLNQNFDIFRKEMSKKYKDEKMETTYPRNRRFCSIYDRRKLGNENNKGKEDNIIDDEELIIYEPTDDSDKFPENGKHVQMFYFEASRKCVIPGYDVKNDAGQREKMTKSIITSQCPCQGGRMTLSFHVESVDEIRCYLFLNGQSLRFMPEDIILVLPIFFDPKVAIGATVPNEKWKESKEAKELIELMKPKLRDVHFSAFLKKNTSFPGWRNNLPNVK